MDTRAMTIEAAEAYRQGFAEAKARAVAQVMLHTFRVAEPSADARREMADAIRALEVGK